jgi:tripartite ATP-independent transporter DctM subunit
MDPGLLGVISLIVILGLLVMGIPVAFTLGGLGILGMALVVGPKGAIGHLASAAYGISAQYGWAVAPLFLVMGALAGMAGVTTEAFDAARKWFGRLPGGLAIATCVAAGIFAACCGSTVASSALFTPLALPEMLRHGYDKRLSLGVITASGTFAAMIPPSLAMVIYCLVTGESIGKLLIAGIIPGILTVVVYSTAIYVWAMRNPKIAPVIEMGATWHEKFRSIKGIWGVLCVFLLILGGIYAGWFSPSAAGAVGVCFIFLIAMIRKRISWKGLVSVSLETALVNSSIYIIVIGGSLFARFWVISGVVARISNFVTELPIPPIWILLMLILLTLLLGCFLDSPSLMILSLPLIYPIVIKLGYSGIWFGVVMVKSIEIGCITPPVGLNAFVVSSTARVELDEVFRGIVPFLVLEVITLGLLIAFPQIALFLPNMMTK